MFAVRTEVWFRPPISPCSGRSHRRAGRSFNLCSHNTMVPVNPNNLNPRFGLQHWKLAVSHSSWSASEIVEAVEGDMERWGPPGAICTDTRTLIPGQWFFAIVGKCFDAHDFVNLALEDMGCVGVIGNRVCEGWGRGFIRVEGDTLTALEKMAIFARNRFDGIVVGLTGSVGKTTTRTMIALALESLGQVYQTPWNHNNQLGVAMTLIGIPQATQVSVLELGMRGKGEILQLAQMCQPTVRVVLNVHHSHMINFSSLEEIAAAKGELLMEAKPGDICILNADDPLVMSIPVPVGVKKVYFGQKMGCDIRLVLAEVTDGGCAVRVILERWQILHPGGRAADMVEFKIHGPGLHLAMNACAAAATAVSLGVSLLQIGNSLSKFRPVTMRSDLVAVGNGVRIINDTYNANFTSMKTAISSLISMECRGKRVAILGDMLELGSTEAEAHEAVLNLCCDACVDLLVLVGKRFVAASENVNLLSKINFIRTFDSDSLPSTVTKMLAPDDVVLVKGSRAMHMEKVVDVIKKMINRVP